MRFFATVPLFVAAAVHAAMYNVTVGTGGLVFTPSNIANVTKGDVISLSFTSGSHTLTQSTFASPCAPVSNGIDSGSQKPGSVYNYTVVDSNPAWFYCKTGTHCSGSGMVFALNPTADKSFAAFQQNAKSGGAPTASGNGSGSQNPTGTAPPSAYKTNGATVPRPAVGAGVGVIAGVAALLLGASVA